MTPQLKATASAAKFIVGKEPEGYGLQLSGDFDAMQAPIARRNQVDVVLQVQAALDALRKGHGTWEHCNTLAEASNYSLLFCEKGIGPEYLGVTHEAQDALIRIKERANRTRRYVADGPGLQALVDLVDLYEQQLADERCTPVMWTWATLECEKRIAFGNVVRTA